GAAAGVGLPAAGEAGRGAALADPGDGLAGRTAADGAGGRRPGQCRAGAGGSPAGHEGVLALCRPARAGPGLAGVVGVGDPPPGSGTPAQGGPGVSLDRKRRAAIARAATRENQLSYYLYAEGVGRQSPKSRSAP